MSKDECPCKGCTAETGRAPGCHTAACPRGWFEWDKRHQSEREERRDSVLKDVYAYDTLVTGTIRRTKRRNGR